MSPVINNVKLFFNYEVEDRLRQDIKDIPVLFGNWCFSPVRYFFDGGKVTIRDNEVRYERNYRPTDKTWLKTVIKMILLVPGLLVGTIAKGASYAFSAIRKDHQIALPFLPYFNKHQDRRDMQKNSRGIERLIGIKQKNGENIDIWEAAELTEKKA